ncbi:MAG TPA: hypothetical protein VM869_30795 [Enhygromyxa sp.]|nr:hypothetical protein [Enhygromyxa sp.]
MKHGSCGQLVGLALALLMVSGCVVAEPEPDEVGDETGDGDGDTGDGDGDAGDGDGDGDPPIIPACSDLCAAYDECGGAEPGCAEDCVAYLSGFADAECLASELELTECLANLNCQELDAFGEQEPPFPCQAEQEALCGEGECTIGVIGDSENAGVCEVFVTCQGQERSIECDGSICTCRTDGVETGGCTDVLSMCDEPSLADVTACCG